MTQRAKYGLNLGRIVNQALARWMNVSTVCAVSWQTDSCVFRHWLLMNGWWRIHVGLPPQQQSRHPVVESLAICLTLLIQWSKYLSEVFRERNSTWIDLSWGIFMAFHNEASSLRFVYFVYNYKLVLTCPTAGLHLLIICYYCYYYYYK